MSIRYYISSARLTAKELLESTRTHWLIEVQLHWKLDVGISEDECRIRRDEAGENFVSIRYIAFNMLNSELVFNVNKNEQVEIMATCRNSLRGKGLHNLVLDIRDSVLTVCFLDFV